MMMMMMMMMMILIRRRNRKRRRGMPHKTCICTSAMFGVVALDGVHVCSSGNARGVSYSHQQIQRWYNRFPWSTWCWGMVDFCHLQRQEIPVLDANYDFFFAQWCSHHSLNVPHVLKLYMLWDGNRQWTWLERKSFVILQYTCAYWIIFNSKLRKAKM